MTESFRGISRGSVDHSMRQDQWVKINTGRLAGLVDDHSKAWCCQCEQETSLKEKAEEVRSKGEIK